jgi:hypothetical protein
MLPERPLNAKPRKAVLISGAITSCGFGSMALLLGHAPPNALSFLALASVFAANAGIVFYAWPTTDGFLIQDRGSRKRRKGGPSGLGPAAAAAARTPAPPTPGRHPALRATARLMPRTAGRRWLAEAESLLFEMPAAQRRKALRSYLLSAPRLLALLWTRELSRRARRAR